MNMWSHAQIKKYSLLSFKCKYIHFATFGDMYLNMRAYEEISAETLEFIENQYNSHVGTRKGAPACVLRGMLGYVYPIL